jgi:5-methylcytosine-specific restriction endonuclease McrA
METEILKICSKCTKAKPLSEFHKKKDGKYGVQPKCKECVLEYARNRYYSNYEHVRELNRVNQIKHKYWLKRDRVRENGLRRQRYAKNETYRESQKAHAREWQSTNKERKRAKHAAWVKVNRERVNEYNRRSIDKHRAKRRLKWVENSAKRRAMRREAPGSFTVAEWEALVEKYGRKCLCCGKSEPEIKLTADHVVPLVLGGSNDIGNIQPLCSTCNSSKNATIADYRPVGGN